MDPSALRDAGAWVVQLVRALKTCRLYDPNNPAVVRFREEVVNDLRKFLAHHGPLRLDVTSSALHYAGHEVHAARSRDDNLAGVLHRDGIRAITLQMGIEAREVESLIDHILHVTGPAAGDDDLVTLFWEANLPNVELVTAPLDGDADGGGEEEGASGPAPIAWPRQAGAGAAAGDTARPPNRDAAGRSDDWMTTENSGDLDQAFDDLESGALGEIARFQREQEEAARTDLVPGTVEIMEDCLASDPTPADREDLAHFLPQLLREAMGLGQWETARAALRLLRACDPGWVAHPFFEGITGAYAITTRRAIAALDQNDAAGVESFLDLVREFGPPATEWLMQVLSESQQKRARRPLAKVIAALIAANPERILPWLSDERWYVVRNVVHIFGWIGGEGVVGFLRVASKHAEVRVRREVVAALSEVDSAAARPILLEMLAAAEPPLFGAILHQLAPDGDKSISEALLGIFGNERFAQRSEGEKRAVYLALATRGDEVLADLEAALFKGGLFSGGHDAERQAMALCIARIGTPSAVAILERGARSNRAAIRKACQIAGTPGDAAHE